MPKRRYVDWKFPHKLIPSSVSGHKTSLGKSFVDIRDEQAFFEIKIDGLLKPLYITIRVSSSNIDNVDFLKSAVQFAVEKVKLEIKEYENPLIPGVYATSSLYTYPEKY